MLHSVALSKAISLLRAASIRALHALVILSLIMPNLTGLAEAAGSPHVETQSQLELDTHSAHVGKTHQRTISQYRDRQAIQQMTETPAETATAAATETATASATANGLACGLARGLVGAAETCWKVDLRPGMEAPGAVISNQWAVNSYWLRKIIAGI
ncbi:MAG TPA: hypothetical protein VJ020_02525 [Anaerolineales bacterium]|nr:hypothetical protein [Anaerolineales bacterium]